MTMSIGQLARRTGVSVKALRFYSDRGLLPPVGRSASGYRRYDDASVWRVEVIRTLREAGLGLERIGAVLADETSLTEALRLQLAAIEAHIASLNTVARALRATLRAEPSERDLRRLSMVSRMSFEERQRVIQQFYDRVSEGIPIDEEWRRQMIAASVPPLPEDPTAEQIDAWVELGAILSDPLFLDAMRAAAAKTWQPGLDPTAYKAAADRMVAESQGLRSDEPAAAEVVRRCLDGMAAASGRTPDQPFREELLARFEQQDPRASRYWELVGVLRGAPRGPDHGAAWRWFLEAARHHRARVLG